MRPKLTAFNQRAQFIELATILPCEHEMITCILAPISALASTAFTAAHAQEPTQQSRQQEQGSTVREDVKNDLSDWREAGFDQHSYDVLSYDIHGAEYQRRYAKYQELKQLRARENTKDQ